jgi:hypothetical protein
MPLNERMSAPPSISSSRSLGSAGFGSAPPPSPGPGAGFGPGSTQGVYGAPPPMSAPMMSAPYSAQYSPYGQPPMGQMPPPQRASRTGLWVGLGAFALVVVIGIVGVVVHLLDVQSAQTAQLDAGGAAPVTPPTTVEVPTATVATNDHQGGGKQPGHPAPTGGAFPRTLAEEKIDRVAATVGGCKREATATGASTVSVTFQPTGVVDATVDAPYKGTSAGACIVAKFGSVGVGKFTGSAVTVTHSISISP